MNGLNHSTKPPYSFTVSSSTRIISLLFWRFLFVILGAVTRGSIVSARIFWWSGTDVYFKPFFFTSYIYHFCCLLFVACLLFCILLLVSLIDDRTTGITAHLRCLTFCRQSSAPQSWRLVWFFCFFCQTL